MSVQGRAGAQAVGLRWHASVIRHALLAVGYGWVTSKAQRAGLGRLGPPMVSVLVQGLTLCRRGAGHGSLVPRQHTVVVRFAHQQKDVENIEWPYGIGLETQVYPGPLGPGPSLPAAVLAAAGRRRSRAAHRWV